MNNNGVKVTYIETQFVTSDAASFKSLVQRLTGKSAEAPEPARQPHRPRPCRPGTDGRTAIAGAPSYCMPTGVGSASTASDNVRTATTASNTIAGASQPCLDEMHGLCDYSELSYVVDPSEWRHGGSYSDLLY
ncbi:hypothetical protein QYE76_022076 [Lolium multiflorum]|uniref:VQ domain-containing protein n=1 Tax=Lolium multiflorum TaxID=4521 RepID=A0AAD8RBY2_LOLMU|nr:hypothetical protein QYE76_022076 [Lolium multiflorum]